MALAEARAAWQRTANRCFVQEDAKRAPKLACCSSLPPSTKQPDIGATGGQDIPTSAALPFNPNPSFSNLSPNSKWWLQQQPNLVYQKCLMDQQFHSLENNMETCQNDVKEVLGVKEEELKALGSCDSHDPYKCEVKQNVGELKDEVLVGCEVSKNSHKLCFDSESSWIGAEKSIPWWRTADTEELALLVAQRSLDSIENCDLPMPQNTHVKKDLDVNTSCFSHDGVSCLSLDSKPGARNQPELSTRICTPDRGIPGSACRIHRMSPEGQLMPSTDAPLSPSCERIPEIHTFENDRSKAQLLEALCRSQTRAREAEIAAEQACAEKEHVVKLVLRQASQLFAYKQWLQLLQLENMYLQFKNSKNHSLSIVFPPMVPQTPQRTRKTVKNSRKSFNRKWAKQGCPPYDVSKYAVAFAVGLGLVGAGLLLGWTVGLMLPTW